ncbi:hypothetical protein [Dysosmobacter sp. Sow4_B12]
MRKPPVSGFIDSIPETEGKGKRQFFAASDDPEKMAACFPVDRAGILS